MSYLQQQRAASDHVYSVRERTLGADRLTRYLTCWRLADGINRLVRAAAGRLTHGSRILVLCSGEGLEGSLLCDLGFTDVTIADLSAVAVAQGLRRDPRLCGVVVNAEQTGLPDGSFDVVLVQDALHHLQNPVLGFTEMLRLARVGVMFIEPHELADRQHDWDPLGAAWHRGELCVSLDQEADRGCRVELPRAGHLR